MSWDATLETAGEGHMIASWNCTHNINKMIREAGDPGWWDSLDGLTGTEGAALLARIITGLEADPERFRAMDPPNGWGSYDLLLPILREMRDKPGKDGEHTIWRVSG